MILSLQEICLRSRSHNDKYHIGLWDILWFHQIISNQETIYKKESKFKKSSKIYGLVKMKFFLIALVMDLFTPTKILIDVNSCFY